MVCNKWTQVNVDFILVKLFIHFVKYISKTFQWNNSIQYPFIVCKLYLGLVLPSDSDWIKDIIFHSNINDKPQKVNKMIII